MRDFFFRFLGQISRKLKVRLLQNLAQSAYVLNVTVNFSEVKVKVQGQNRRSENLPVVIFIQMFHSNLPVVIVR